MAALVVFESMFGNTKMVADAVAEGLARHLRVEQVEVGAAPMVFGGEVELLVVGGPTHPFGLSRPGTRQSAAQQADGGLVSAGIGLREWLGTLQKGSSTVAVAHLRHPHQQAAAAGIGRGRRRETATQARVSGHRSVNELLRRGDGGAAPEGRGEACPSMG